jgi:CelD/BcsL family acetyltransferase involved in cellulose biosynthesis
MPMVVKIHNRIEPLMSDWEHLARRIKAPPFLWPGWIRAWWHAFGAGQLHILTVCEDGCLTGVLPLRKRRRILISPTNGDTPLFGFLAATESAARTLSHTVFCQPPSQVHLSFLCPTDAGVSLVHEAADNAKYRVYMEAVEAAPYVVTDGSWNDYENGLRRKFRSELRRRRKRLGEEGQLTLEVSDGTENLEKRLQEGFRIEASGWKEAYGTSINRNPSLQRFYIEVAQWAAERGWLRLAFLRLDGQAVAFDYCVEYNKTHYLLKNGYESAYAKFAPGMVMRYFMLNRAFSAKDIATYDFLGVGSSAWKREWTNRQQERLFMHMFAPTALGQVGRVAFRSRATALDLTKNLVRDSTLNERHRRRLRRIYEALHAKLG